MSRSFGSRFFALAAGVASISLAAAGLAAPAVHAASTGNVVRIGLEAPLSGDQKTLGQGMLEGAKLAAAELNAAGGINGKQVEIVPVDDAADPQTGVTAAKAAIAGGLDGIVGPYNSGVGAETLPLYLAAGLVPIRLTSADSTNGLGYTLQPMTYQIAPVAAKAVTTWAKAASVAIVYDDTTLYTKSVSEALKSQLEAAGTKIAAYQPIKPGKKSYTAVVKQLSRTKPDLVYVATYYPEGGLIAKEMLSLGIKAKCMADYGSYDSGFVKVAGKKAAQNCPVVGVPAPNEFTAAGAHVSAYRKEFGTAPGTWSPYTYDSVKLLAYAATQSGGFDAAALTNVLNTVTDWSGWTGSVKIDAANGNRDPATVVVLDTKKDGTFKVDPNWSTAVGAGY
jgi:ABC-type branched-subunit amino acid transport system substrate-binding protein